MRFIALAAVVLPAISFTGCAVSSGSESVASSVMDHVASAAEASTDAGTAHFELASGMFIDGLTIDSIESSGIIDFENKRVEQEGTIGLYGGAFEFRSIFVGTSSYFQLKQTSPSMVISAEQGEKFSSLPPGIEWVHSEVDDATADSIASAFQSPGDMFDTLRESARSVEESGTENIRGTQCTLYVASIPGDELLEMSDDELGDLEWDLPDSVDVYVCIDAGRFVRRVEYTAEINTSYGTIVFGGWTEYFDYGDPISIQAPDPSTVMSEDEFQKHLSSD